MIVWCEVAFLQYLRLLRQTVRADTRTYNLQQTMGTGCICYNNKKWYEGTRALAWVVTTLMCISLSTMHDVCVQLTPSKTPRIGAAGYPQIGTGGSYRL